MWSQTFSQLGEYVDPAHRDVLRRNRAANWVLKYDDAKLDRLWKHVKDSKDLVTKVRALRRRNRRVLAKKVKACMLLRR